MKYKTVFHIFLLWTLWVFLFNKLIKIRQMPQNFTPFTTKNMPNATLRYENMLKHIKKTLRLSGSFWMRI